MATPEWESVRQRNGWRTLFTSQDAFVDVLEAQEQQLRDAMEALGFIHR
jgi:putative tricarboxylic transport membrane protein